MKTERRHELQTNVLADWLGKKIEAIKPHMRLITFGLITGLVLIIGFLWWRGTTTRTEGAGWRTFFLAAYKENSEAIKELENLADAHSGSSVAMWALQSAGDLELSSGVRQLFRDRELAVTSLNAAKDKYKAVESGAKSDTLKRRAQFGLGQVYEALSEIEDARKYYELVSKSGPDTALGRESTRRLELLDNATERWYYWFSNQKPRLPGSPLPGMNPLGTAPLNPTPGGTGGISPDLNTDLSELFGDRNKDSNENPDSGNAGQTNSDSNDSGGSGDGTSGAESGQGAGAGGADTGNQDQGGTDSDGGQ